MSVKVAEYFCICINPLLIGLYDMIALVAMKAMSECGIHVPEDVSVIG